MTERIVTIHQPQYMPWIPLFGKILMSDIFILLDNVAFQKNGLQNRNEIKTANGRTWLTVPVSHKLGQPIKETKISNKKMLGKHLKTLELNYKKAPYFQRYFPDVAKILENSTDSLSELNNELIRYFLACLDYKGDIKLASNMQSQGKNTELVRNLCLEVNAPIYLSGGGGRNYLDENDFKKNNIQILYHKYNVQPYTQLFPKQPFMPDLAMIDLLFNCGTEARAHIEKGQLPCEPS